MSQNEKAKSRAGKAVKAKKGTQRDVYHGVVVDDPYRALEDLDAPETKAWTEKQNARYERYIADFDKRDKMEAKLKDVWDYPSNSLPSRYKNRYFDFYNPGLAPQDIMRVKTGKKGKWRTLIDPNKMSQDGTVALSGTSISPNGKYVAYFISEAGSDAQTLKVKNVITGKDLTDKIENCRFTSIIWDKDSDKGFTYSYPAADDKKRMMLKHHNIGDDIQNDPKIFEHKNLKDSFVSLSRPKYGSHEYIYTRIGTDPNNGIHFRKQGSTGSFKKLFDIGEADYSILGEIDGYIYMTTNKDAPHSKLVKFKLDKPEPQNWETVIPEHSTDILGGVIYQQGKLFPYYSHDTADIFQVFKTDGTKIADIPLPPQSVFGIAKRNKEDTSFLLKISNHQQPGEVYKYDIPTQKMTLVEETKAKADLKDCIVERIYATSKDGTKVPMTIIRHPDTKLDGTAATKLYGYGGFNVSLGPGFSNGVMNWVKNGGIYAQANLRGGGEFGKDWYDNGRLLKKQNVFDDFFACAEHLSAKKYTNNKRLVIEGGSNGGLLTAACILQRPELYGAVISDVPVMDMLRFHKHTYGSLWKSDYGDPENNEADFKAAMKYSPLHNVKKGQFYPPLLVKTADHDDRVVPSHAFKFVAEMLEKADPNSTILMRVEKSAGHGAGKPTDKIIKDIVDTFAFVENSIGFINQKAYKKQLAAEVKAQKKKISSIPKKPKL